jgi:hypothetical protein
VRHKDGGRLSVARKSTFCWHAQAKEKRDGTAVVYFTEQAKVELL